MRKKLLLVSLVCFTQIAFASIRLPFRIKGGLIIAEFNFNGKAKVPFVFDTGASTTVIDSTAASYFQLKPEGRQPNVGASGAAWFPIIYNQTVLLAKDEVVNLMQCTIVNLQDLRERNGEDFVGIIGYDLLKNYVTTIDFDKKELIFDTKSPDNLSDYARFPFTFGNHITIPQLTAAITLQSGNKLEGTVFFDSGASLTLLVNSPFRRANLPASVLGKIITSKNHDLTRENTLEETEIESIQIGDFKFSALPVSLSTETRGVTGYNGYLGILGNKIISRFNVVLDYREKVIYLKPNQSHSAPFDFPMSGLRFKKINGKIFISSVADKSPAAESGLKEEQAVVSVDGYKGNDLDRIYKLLQQEGKTVNVTISSSGEQKDIPVKLQKML